MISSVRGAAAPPPTVVAIPARNEADRIARCLDALAAQQSSQGRPVSLATPVKVLVLINNTSDDTARRVERWRAGGRLDVDVGQVDLGDAGHAGTARKAAMDWASEVLRGLDDGLICTTDADSEAETDWLANTWSAIEDGVDAVAGMVVFDPDGLNGLGLSPLRRLEARYAILQAQLIASTDPEPHDPWPNHIWAWGASLAVRASAYRAIGGLPPAPVAEDRALAGALRARDFKVRHALDVRVRTSLRDSGRAAGGLADLVRLYSTGDDTAPCDAELEGVSATIERATCRRLFRRARNTIGQRGHDVSTLARRLSVAPAVVLDALDEAHFGAGWQHLERLSPALRRERLYPSDLPRQIVLAETVLIAAGAVVAAPPGDRTRVASAGLWSTPGRQFE